MRVKTSAVAVVGCGYVVCGYEGLWCLDFEHAPRVCVRIWQVLELARLVILEFERPPYRSSHPLTAKRSYVNILSIKHER